MTGFFRERQYDDEKVRFLEDRVEPLRTVDPVHTGDLFTGDPLRADHCHPQVCAAGRDPLTDGPQPQYSNGEPGQGEVPFAQHPLPPFLCLLGTETFRQPPRMRQHHAQRMFGHLGDMHPARVGDFHAAFQDRGEKRCFDPRHDQLNPLQLRRCGKDLRGQLVGQQDLAVLHQGGHLGIGPGVYKLESVKSSQDGA